MIATDWAAIGVTAAAALVAAVVGGLFVLWAARQSLLSAAEESQNQRTADRASADEQYRRELLSKAADRLLDALWTKERELCEALHQCRVEVEEGVEPSADDPAFKELGRLDLAVYQDMITALPFIQDQELRERMRSAAQMVNDCYNIRAGSRPDAAKGGTVTMYGRAMIEVQAYFKWLRWNLALALQGEELPRAVEMPDVRRAEGGSGWSLPAGVPQWT